MIAWQPIVGRLYRYATSWGSSSGEMTFKLEPVTIHDVEHKPEKRSRTLKHLIKANHINHSILYHHMQFSNHTPHILCSAYLLGANEDQLHHIYDEESKVLEEWHDSPAEISHDDWRLFLGKREYQRAYVDFFEDELALKHDYDWKTVAREFLFEGKSPLINCAISNVGHPLIHLGYAFEMDNREIGMEALGMLASEYCYYHKYSDDPTYTKPSPNPSPSIRTLIDRLASDSRFDNLFTEPGAGNLHAIFSTHEALTLEYWNSWTITEPLKQFEESQEVAMQLLTHTISSSHGYDFFLCHLLTTSHAVRILLPSIPPRFQLSVVRQWWLLTIAVYIAQLRPKINDMAVRLLSEKEQEGKSWKYVEHKAITHQRFSTDAHYVKAIRAMKEAAMTWGDAKGQYLSSAVGFADGFDGWSGFGTRDTSEFVY